MNLLLRLLTATLAGAFLFCGTLNAQLLVITHTGTGSGTLLNPPDGSGSVISFTNASFTITATLDTAYRGELYNSDSARYGYYIDNSPASISINGVGDFTFTSQTRTLVNNSIGMVAFTHGGSDPADLFDGPSDAAFYAWDMLTGIGPISGTASLIQWNPTPYVNTNGGRLIFNDASDVTTTFTATAIPEPSTCVALLGLGALGFAAWRRLHRKVR